MHTGLVPRFPTAILVTGMVIVAVLCFFAGLILDTVTRGRREVRRLAYLSLSAAGPGVVSMHHRAELCRRCDSLRFLPLLAALVCGLLDSARSVSCRARQGEACGSIRLFARVWLLAR